MTPDFAEDRYVWCIPFGFEQSSYHTVVLDDTIPPGVPSEYVVLSIGEGC